MKTSCNNSSTSSNQSSSSSSPSSLLPQPIEFCCCSTTQQQQHNDLATQDLSFGDFTQDELNTYLISKKLKSTHKAVISSATTSTKNHSPSFDDDHEENLVNKPNQLNQPSICETSNDNRDHSLEREQHQKQKQSLEIEFGFDLYSTVLRLDNKRPSSDVAAATATTSSTSSASLTQGASDIKSFECSPLSTIKSTPTTSTTKGSSTNSSSSSSRVTPTAHYNQQHRHNHYSNTSKHHHHNRYKMESSETLVNLASSMMDQTNKMMNDSTNNPNNNSISSNSGDAAAQQRRNKKRKPPNYYQTEYAAVIKLNGDETTPPSGAAVASEAAISDRNSDDKNSTRTSSDNETAADRHNHNHHNHKHHVNHNHQNAAEEESSSSSSKTTSISSSSSSSDPTESNRLVNGDDDSHTSNEEDTTQQLAKRLEKSVDLNTDTTTTTTTSNTKSNVTSSASLTNAASTASKPPAATAWSSLFKSTTQQQQEHSTAKSSTKQPPSNSQSSGGVTTTINHHHHNQIDQSTSMEALKHLGHVFKQCELKHSAPALQPRGLSNRSNWCYVNATLQALLACPPFYNLVKSVYGKMKSSASPQYAAMQLQVPFVAALGRFISEFKVMIRTSVSSTSSQSEVTTGKKELIIGEPFECEYFYELLKSAAATTDFKTGRQEDAQEFLSFLLNRVHDEMVKCLDSLNPTTSKQHQVNETDYTKLNGKSNGVSHDDASGSGVGVADINGDGENDEWREVGRKNKAFVTRKIEAFKRISFEDLPPVLIIYLKCFVFDKYGGSQKLLKRVDFQIDLEISRELIASTQRSKLREKERRAYKLFAVEYHHGEKASGGHYITDVYHPGIVGWVRYDDAHVRVVSNAQVLKSDDKKLIPYLLYYRRCDLI